MWDAGYCFEKSDVEKSSYIVLGAAGFLTVLVWIIAFSTGGGA